MSERVRASYRMQTAMDAAAVAAGIAGEQSCGTFIALPQEDEALKERAAARVEALEEVAALDAGGPSDAGSRRRVPQPEAMDAGCGITR